MMRSTGVGSASFAPGEMELSPQLLARAARSAEAVADPEVVEAGRRGWTAVRPSWMQDSPVIWVMAHFGHLAGQNRRYSD